MTIHCNNIIIDISATHACCSTIMDFSSDCESIRTEDFVSKFCEYVPADNCKDSGFSCDKSEQCATPIPREQKYGEFSPLKSENYLMRNEPRSSSAKHIYDQTLDLDSIATEMFEDQLHNLQDSQMLSGRSVPTESCNTSLHLGNLSNVQPIRRDIMNKFLSKYSIEEEKLQAEIRNTSIEQQRPKIRISNENERPQNGKKEVNWKTDCNKNQNPQIRYNNDLANDIRKKSIRIQNEIQEERRRKLDSIQEMNIIRERTPREQLDIKVKELDQLTDKMRKARADREKISEELNSLRNNIRSKSIEPRCDQKWKSGRNDNVPYCKTNLMPTSENQLINLNSQLLQKKTHLKDLEERIRQRLSEIQDLESIGLSKQEIKQVVEERNELYEILRLSEENGNDRYELEKKLTETKEELTLEHKRSREKIMKLEEQLDNGFKKISVIYEEKERLSKELISYKEIIQKQQDDINEIYTERNDLRYQIEKYKEELDSEKGSAKAMLEQERKRFECHLATEEAQTKLITTDLKNQLLTLQFENNSNVEKNLIYKSRISQLENEFEKLKNDFELQENDFKDQTERIIEEKNQAVEKFRREYYSKKENEIQNIKIELDSEQMRTIHNLKECYKQQIADLQSRLENKGQELQEIKSDIRKAKQDFSDKESSLKSHYETEIIRLKEELNRNVEGAENRRSEELDEIKTKYEGLLRNKSKQIEEERVMNNQLRSALEKANKDILQESELAKKFKNDKLTAISKVKETAKEKLQEEFKNLKQFYEKELEEQLKLVEQTMQEKNAQLLSKSKEVKALQLENMEMKSVFQNNFSDILDAIKYQCSQMASEGKFVLPSFRNIKITDEMDVNDFTQLIIRNFQICCQEYSQYNQEIVENSKEDKDVSIKMMEEKSSRDIQAIKEQILKDHADELNSLNLHHKQELNVFQRTHHEEIETLRRNVKEWKQKTADRLAQKLHKEFKKELEKNTNKQELNRSSSLSLHSYKNDVNSNSMKPIGLIEDLRSNIRQLRDENLSLRKVILGQNVSHLSEYENQKESYYNDKNDSVNSNVTSARPQSVGHDSYKHKHDAPMSRSGSYRILKQ